MGIKEKVSVERLEAGIASSLSAGDAERFGRARLTVEGKLAPYHNRCGYIGIVVCERDPIDFIAAVCVALRFGHAVFFGNADWRSREWEAMGTLCGRVVVLGETTKDWVHHETSELKQIATGIYIPTGGSSGRLRFAHHSLRSLQAHVGAFVKFFGFKKVNSLCALPLYHVSGWMQVMRSAMTGGALRFLESDELSDAATLAGANADGWCLSVVPTQLVRLLARQDAIGKLSKLAALFIGGAAVSPALISRIKGKPIAAWLTYGMTETASMVAVASLADLGDDVQRLPLARLLPHTRAEVRDDGLWLKCESICSGYLPMEDATSFKDGWFRTADDAELTEAGHLRVLGRVDDVIITGGEKVWPVEVANMCMSFTGVKDCHVYGEDDPYWGQQVCAWVVGLSSEEQISALSDYLKQKLAGYKVPKSIQRMESIPRNGVGKVVS